MVEHAVMEMHTPPPTRSRAPPWPGGLFAPCPPASAALRPPPLLTRKGLPATAGLGFGGLGHRLGRGVRQVGSTLDAGEARAGARDVGSMASAGRRGRSAAPRASRDLMLPGYGNWSVGWGWPPVVSKGGGRSAAEAGGHGDWRPPPPGAPTQYRPRCPRQPEHPDTALPWALVHEGMTKPGAWSGFPPPKVLFDV